MKATVDDIIKSAQHSLSVEKAFEWIHPVEDVTGNRSENICSKTVGFSKFITFCVSHGV